MLTRVTFVCDDSKVGQACRSLTGIAIEQPTVQPMANAMIATKAQSKGYGHGRTGPKSEVRAAHNGQTLPEMIKSQISEEGLEQISTSTIKVMVTELGYAPLSSAKTIQGLVHKYKFLRRVGRGQYEVRKT